MCALKFKVRVSSVHGGLDIFIFVCYLILSSLLTRYLEIVDPIWHKTHFNKKWLYICFAIIWPFGIVFNAAIWIPIQKVGSENDLVKICFTVITIHQFFKSQ